MSRAPARTLPEAPNALWPTDNDYQVPVLDRRWQAETLDVPVVKWGTIGRGRPMLGTYHFYTDDYKFERLWADSRPLVRSGCVNAVEPNFSITDSTPYPVALHQIYRKRWLSRFWQTQGIAILVDLAVPPRYRDLGLQGVPSGWRAYATRGWDDHDCLHADYAAACQRAQSADLLFVVMGGGRATRDLCQRMQWLHVPEHRHVVDERFPAYGS